MLRMIFEFNLNGIDSQPLNGQRRRSGQLVVTLRNTANIINHLWPDRPFLYQLK